MPNQKTAEPDVGRIRFVKALKRYMLAAGLNQKKLASRMNVTTGAVWQWCAGKSLPEAEKFPKLAKLLGVKPIDLTKLLDPDIDDAPIHESINAR